MDRPVRRTQLRTFRLVRAFADHRKPRRLALSCAALLVLSGCGGDSDEPVLAGGRALYEANCMSCHGETALGDGPLASTLPVAPPGLKEHLGHHTQTELIRLIQGGVPPAMPPTPLDDAEIQLIVDYLWTLVPESEVAALREMQLHMEMMGDSPSGSMQGMPGMHQMPGMDSTPMPPMDADGSAAPEAPGGV
jgi:mono/diheme cytochrome c family protein